MATREAATAPTLPVGRVPGTGAEERPIRALLVGGDPGVQRALAQLLGALGCDTRCASAGGEAVDAATRWPFDVAIWEARVDEPSLELLPHLKAAGPGAYVVVVAERASFDEAVEAMRCGASDYLQGPLTAERIRALVEEQVERKAAEVRDPPVPSPEPHLVPEAAWRMLSGAARDGEPVLLRGERGTGRLHLSRALHEQGRRGVWPFVAVDCRGRSESARAVEIRGGESGAEDEPRGWMEAVALARSGTLYLREVGALPSGLQGELVRWLEARRSGDGFAEEGPWLVAATSRDLAAEVEAGLFRRDLYYLLLTREVLLPPLRDRPDEVLPLAEEILEGSQHLTPGRALRLSLEARRMLVSWPWPGNAAELKELLAHACVRSTDGLVGPDAFPPRMALGPRTPPAAGGAMTLGDLEREHVRRVLAWAPSAAEAARILGIDPSSLRRKRRAWARRETRRQLRRAPAAGNVNQKVLPEPGPASRPIEPPCAATTSREM